MRSEKDLHGHIVALTNVTVRGKQRKQWRPRFLYGGSSEAGVAIRRTKSVSPRPIQFLYDRQLISLGTEAILACRCAALYRWPPLQPTPTAAHHILISNTVTEMVMVMVVKHFFPSESASCSATFCSGFAVAEFRACAEKTWSCYFGRAFGFAARVRRTRYRTQAATCQIKIEKTANVVERGTRNLSKT